jgi:hypothetical protein
MSGEETKDFPDVVINDAKRQLVVRTRYHADEGRWQVSIEDGSPDKRFTGRRLREFVIGSTSVWCGTRNDTIRQRNYLVATAKVGRWS